MQDIEIEASEYAQKAMNNFLEGYNCTQAVVLAFEDKFPMDRKSLLSMSSSFGGGMGRLREVCGTVSGMFLVAGMLYGYDLPGDIEGKKLHYERIQELAAKFREANGSIVCRELLGLSIKGADRPEPEVRSAEYYKKRPCVKLVGMSAAIMEQYIREHEAERMQGTGI